jgi:hypothetical protein
MCEIQLAGVEGLLHIVPPDDFMNSNPHEWMMFLIQLAEAAVAKERETIDINFIFAAKQATTSGAGVREET